MIRNIKRRSIRRANLSRSINFAKLFTCLALAYTVSITPAFSQQIVTDGNTNTNLAINANTTNVTTSTIKNNNAFNSFSKFNVDTGNVVNLVVPDSSNNLINLVNSEATNINGVLNSIKNNHIGGNIFLVNPYGITVGVQGVVNVGSLTAVTPTTNFVNTFFTSPGQPNDASVNALINGTAPINPNAVINIEGKINAIESVKLGAGGINHSGEIYTGAVFQENDISIGDVVNINTLASIDTIGNSNGDIILYSSGSRSVQESTDSRYDIYASASSYNKVKINSKFNNKSCGKYRNTFCLLC